MPTRLVGLLLGLLGIASTTGCYAPLHSPAVSANCLPAAYRTPQRGIPQQLNLATLAMPGVADYILGAGDELQVTVAGLSNPGPNEDLRPILVTVMADGTVQLPLVGKVHVTGMNLSQAQQAIDASFAPRYLQYPKTSVVLADKATMSIPVIGELISPGVQSLPRFQNDVAHAIAAAGGLTVFASQVVEVHRRVTEAEFIQKVSSLEAGAMTHSFIFTPLPIDTDGNLMLGASRKIILRIPLQRGAASIVVDDQVLTLTHLSVEDITLRQGDVVVVPRQPDEVFFVVGPLSRNNVVNFRVSEMDRRLGNAFILPQDRDVDVVTAVAMAGYIDPIESPTTVTVHRSRPGASPMLIHVDLIAARYDWNENVYVQPGDIIYLNPDAWWWSRRTFDRIVPDLLLAPYREGTIRWINPRSFRN